MGTLSETQFLVRALDQRPCCVKLISGCHFASFRPWPSFTKLESGATVLMATLAVCLVRAGYGVIRVRSGCVKVSFSRSQICISLPDVGNEHTGGNITTAERGCRALSFQLNSQESSVTQ